MKQIPLSKQAGLADTVKDWFISPDAGPLETILTVAEDLGSILTGGTFSVLITALQLIGWDPARLGRVVDQMLGLKTLDDLTGHSPEKLADTAEQAIQHASSGEEQGVATATIVPLSLKKQAIFGASILKRALVFLFQGMFGWLANPNSKLSMGLRAAGLGLAHQHFQEAQTGTRQKTNPAISGTTTPASPKQQLESVVDTILGAS